MPEEFSKRIKWQRCRGGEVGLAARVWWVGRTMVVIRSDSEKIRVTQIRLKGQPFRA